MSGWVLLLFFMTDKGVTNINESGFYKKESQCISESVKILTEISRRGRVFSNEKLWIGYIGEAYCIYTENRK